MITASTISSRPKGRATLPMVELDAAKVRRNDGKPIRPLPKHCDTLSFSAWKLYHAAKRAEFLSTFTKAQADNAAMHFAGEHHELFRWNNKELRLSAGATIRYETASHNYRATRIGEACLLLTMEHKGYAYWDRLDMLLERASRRPFRHSKSTKRPKVRQVPVTKRPDFVHESASGDTAVAEAKGSLIAPGNAGDIKGDLRRALQQLDDSKKLITPRPKRAYAIGTYLREVDDASTEGSLVAFADPEGPEDDNEPTFPPDWVRRGNYGAWLVGMGFEGAGNALRMAIAHEPVQIRLPVKRVADRDYAFVVTHPFWGEHIPDARVRLIADTLRFWPGFWGAPPDWYDFSILGIRTDILEAIARTFVDPQGGSSLDVQLAAVADSEAFDGSIMLDGTLAGAVKADGLYRLRDADFREFRL